MSRKRRRGSGGTRAKNHAFVWASRRVVLEQPCQCKQRVPCLPNHTTPGSEGYALPEQRLNPQPPAQHSSLALDRFWQCPGGKDCKYRHALPPGYILKSQMKELLEEEAANVGPDQHGVVAVFGRGVQPAPRFGPWRRGVCVCVRVGAVTREPKPHIASSTVAAS